MTYTYSTRKRSLSLCQGGEKTGEERREGQTHARPEHKATRDASCDSQYRTDVMLVPRMRITILWVGPSTCLPSLGQETHYAYVTAVSLLALLDVGFHSQNFDFHTIRCGSLT